jgi:HEPN domain-containing protein
MRKSAPLSFPELWDIDHLFNKAGTVLMEARSRLGTFDYDLAVRSAQESLEFFLKSLFRFLQRPYPVLATLKKWLFRNFDAASLKQVL